MKPAIVKAISTVFDPEIPVNIYELGLIYDIIVDANGVAGIRMTLTAPGCPVAHTLPVEVADKVKAVPGITDAKRRHRLGTGVDEGPHVGRSQAAARDVVEAGFQLSQLIGAHGPELKAEGWKLRAES